MYKRQVELRAERHGSREVERAVRGDREVVVLAGAPLVGAGAVSYTHLAVYKRQASALVLACILVGVVVSRYAFYAASIL